MKRIIFGLLATALSVLPASAETMQRPSGATVPSAALMCSNGVTNADGSQQVVPCGSPANPLPVAAGASNASTAGLPATSPSLALSSNWVGCSATCNLYDFQVSTTTASVWVMAFDAVALPSNGAVTPKKWWQVAANATLGVAWSGEPPLNLATGLVLGCSTTGPFTLTASATCTFSGGVKQ